MPAREKRKGRLDKASSSSSSSKPEFIGFSAFATTPDTSSSATTTASTSASVTNWSPVYTGQDETLQLLFSRVGQKRDATTKVKALNELEAFLGASCATTSAAAADDADAAAQQAATTPVTHSYTDDRVLRRVQVQAVQHYSWLYSQKLHYDTAAAVRAAALTVWRAAVQRTRKAVLAHAVVGGGGASTASSSAAGELLGMWWAATADTAAEVRMAATALIQAVNSTDGATSAAAAAASNNNSTAITAADWQEGLVNRYAARILSYGRASALHQALFGKTTKLGSSAPASDQATATTKKGKKQQGQQQGQQQLTAEQKDAAEERFERIVGTCLDALSLWLQRRQSAAAGESNDNTVPTLTLEVINVWWKTLHSNRVALRQKTYRLLAAACSVASSQQQTTILPPLPADTLTTALVQALSSEKQVTNLPVLLETVAAFLSYQQKQQQQKPNDDDDANTALDDDNNKRLQQLVKPLCKVLSKACHGAPVRLWGPTLLPLVALLGRRPQNDQNNNSNALTKTALTILQAAWQGRDLTLGPKEQLSLAQSVAECASFVLLLRPKNNRNGSRDDPATTAPVGKDDETTTTAREIASLWLQTLQLFLASSSTGTGGSAAAESSPYNSLGKQLAKDLRQFQASTETTSETTTCAFDGQADWFWNDGIKELICQSDPAALSELLRAMQNSVSDINNNNKQQVVPTTAVSLLIPHLRVRFETLLADYQVHSGAVPSQQAYDFFLLVLELCGPTNILAAGALEKFIMNELLRWIVLHTSQLANTSQQQQAITTSEWLVQADFGLLQCCLAALDDNDNQRATLWNSLLGQVVAAKCDLHWLVIGLLVLLSSGKNDDDDASWIACDALKTLAIQTAEMEGSAELALDPSHDTDDSHSTASKTDVRTTTASKSDDEYQKRLRFYRLCLGMLRDVSYVLIDRNVVVEWINRACDDGAGGANRNNPLLQVLLELVAKVGGRTDNDEEVVTEEEGRRIAMRSWVQGGHLYDDHVPSILKFRSSAWVEAFLTDALSQLKAQLSKLASVVPEMSVDETAVGTWSGRAVRLLEACKQAPSSSTFAAPSLRLLGLVVDDDEDGVNWESHPILLYKCTMALLQLMNDPAERRALLEQSHHEAGALDLVRILTAINTDSTPTAGLETRSAHRSRHCEKFLSALGGGELDVNLLGKAIETMVLALQRHEDKGGTGEESRLAREVSTLSQLIGCAFQPILSLQTPDLKAEDIKEGSKVFYISDPNNPDVRESVLVSKVHYDAQTGYYFSIRLQRVGGVQERQTVLERLRIAKSSSASERGIVEDQIPEAEQSRRKLARELIMASVIRPFLSSPKGSASTALLGELLGVLAGVIGTGSERGVGSLNYEIFQLVGGADSGLRDALGANDLETSCHFLWTIALTLGYGLNSEARQWSLRRLRFDFRQSSKAVMDLYEKEEIGKHPALDMATLAWITATIEHLLLDSQEQDGNSEAIEGASRIAGLLFRLANSLLSGGQNTEGFSYKLSIGCRAVYEGTKVLAKYSSQLGVAEAEEAAVEASNLQSDALLSLLTCFATTKETSHAEGTPFAVVSKIYGLAKTNDESVLEKLTRACRSNAGGISRALFSPLKRSLAFRLLNLVADSNKPFQPSDGGVDISPATQSNLTSWLEGLDEEEASQLEEDVYIVAEWIPLPVMDQVESWVQEMDYDSLEEPQTIGQLLSWLLFLRFVDASAPCDFRNRPAFVSYLGKCQAVNHILTLALLHEEFINEEKKSTTRPVLLMEELLTGDEDEGDFKLVDIASVAMFRSVEVLPSLSRRWWEEDCPKVYTSPVQTFVEKHVAPEILKRELGRIRSASDVFGAMTVNASAMTREVTAQYIQDEFTLTVLISLPASFPFRSAEVDCSKTLGVSQRRWKRWSLQIMLMLNNQGGTLQDALLLWKDNVDQEFEGVEPCPVCYSVLHVKTHKLPSLECKTCNNRFHVDCLTQWFRSSGKNQCVLCQQPWQGTRV